MERALLEYLCEKTSGDKFKVFDVGELAAVCEDLPSALEILKTSGYAVIKYMDEGEICLCVTSSGRAAGAAASRAQENATSNEELPAAAKGSLWQRVRTAVIAAIAGLFGGAIGGAVMYLILAVTA